MLKLMFEPIRYSARQSSIFRSLLGLYLLVGFVRLFPYVGELYSSQGFFSFHPVIPFPALEFLWGEKLHGQISIAVLAVCAAFFTFGYQRRILALVLWFGWASLLHRLPFFSSPSDGYVGWMILMNVAVPEDRDLPAPLYWCGWALLGFGYCISGFDKWQSPSWQNGEALKLTLESPIATTAFVREWALATPDWFLKTATWGLLLLEMLFAPLVLFNFTRKWAWLAMTLVHVAIFIFLQAAPISLGMLIMHFFVYDPRWFSRGREREEAMPTQTTAANPDT